MNNWFECKVSYDKNGEEGLLKRSSEIYLVDAVSFADSEKRLYEELEMNIVGEFMVDSIKKVKIYELIDSDIDSDDRWFRAKILLITIDENKGVEKTEALCFFVKASNLQTSVEYLINSLKDTISDYRIASVVETPVLDVLKYKLPVQTERK